MRELYEILQADTFAHQVFSGVTVCEMREITSPDPSRDTKAAAKR